MANEERLGKLWKLFYHDVTKVTFHLFTLLHGVELARDKDLSLYQKMSPDVRKWTVRLRSVPSYLDLYPVVMGPDILDDLLCRGGEVEQLAYRGWVVEVYRLWEDRYRRKMEEASKSHGLPDVIPPELPVMGDFRHIRNDLVHGDGKASEAETGKCEVLKWFKAGEQIALHISHVLDFLHRLGCFNFSSVDTGAEVSSWRFDRKELLLSRHPIPRIVSVRTALEVHPDSREIWFLISLVYSNGFFSHHASPTGISHNAANWAQMRAYLDGVEITPEGHLNGPLPWLRVRNDEIYADAVDMEVKRRKGERMQEFPKGGFPGPWVKFRA